MTLRIDRHAFGKQVVLQLVGNLRSEHLDELKEQIKAAGPEMVLDLGGVALISVEGVRLLNSCEDEGIAIKNASPYIAQWMALERKPGPKDP
jgi:anti-anti-sigma regulatory factor